MGRSAYLYFLTLGRQCYEPQNISTAAAPPPPPISHPAASSSHSSSNPQPDNEASSSNPRGEASSSSGAQSSSSGAGAAPPSTESITQTVSATQQSIDLQRSLRKAQNDVLTTIGLQLQKAAPGQRNYREAKNALHEKENDMGLLLGGIDLAAMYFFTWPLIGVRNELQTFRGLDEIPYTSLLSLLIKHRSILDWFSGVSAHIIYQLVNVLREYLQSLLFKRLAKLRIFRDKETRKPNKDLLNFWYKTMTISAFFLIYPIYRHSVLQSLHLIPPTPILPPPSAFIPFRSLAGLPWTSIIKRLLTPAFYLESPYIWSLVQQKAVFRLHILFLDIFNRNLPRTDIYDGAIGGGGFVVGEAGYNEFFSDDEEEDAETVLQAAEALVDGVVDGALMNGVGPALGSGHGQVVAVRTLDDQGEIHDTVVGEDEDELPPFPVDETAGIGILDESLMNGGMETQTFTATITPDTPVRERHEGRMGSVDSGFLDPNPHHARGAHGSGGGNNSNNNDDEDAWSAISEIEVQVTTGPRSGSSHANANANHNHHHHRQQQDGRRRSGRERERRYRNTHLATHPTEVLSSHMADTVAMALTVWLESMVMRANAFSLFATTPGNGDVVLPDSNILVLASNAGMLGLSGAGLLGLGLGRGMSVDGRTRRTGNSRMLIGIMQNGGNWVSVSKALVLEWGVAWGLFEVAWLVSRWVGVRWFGYRM